MGVEEHGTIVNVFEGHRCDDCLYYQTNSDTCSLAVAKKVPQIRTCASWEPTAGS